MEFQSFDYWFFKILSRIWNTTACCLNSTYITVDFQQDIATLGIMNVKNTHSMVNHEYLTFEAFLQKRIRYTHSVQEEVVGGPKNAIFVHLQG